MLLDLVLVFYHITSILTSVLPPALLPRAMNVCVSCLPSPSSCYPLCHVQTLAGAGYAKRVFYFEIIECIRKLSLVCVPVFFVSGSTSQLLFALCITFLTFGIYSTLQPYATPGDNKYALSAQTIIFFNLIISLAQPLGPALDTVLAILLASYTAYSFLLSIVNRFKRIRTSRCIVKLLGLPKKIDTPIDKAQMSSNASTSAELQA